MVNPGGKHLTKSKLLVQEDMDVLSEIVDSSSLAVFNSTRALKPSDISNGRTTIPIIDTFAHVQYYVVCLHTEKERYKKLFKNMKEQESFFRSVFK